MKEQIAPLLRDRFGFQDIQVLPEQQATRKGILKAIERLVADTNPGDLDIFYYAGHGSRRKDTLSSKKDHMDETIVPIDAWKGVEDIRDKELAFLFNQIVYDRHARLTAVFDSCDSGTMARGNTDHGPVREFVVRTLPYDDRDVAEEKKRDPATVVESDLKRKPQDGDAIILAAAKPDQYAIEEKSSDGRWYGAFTRALMKVLQSNIQDKTAADVVDEVTALINADCVRGFPPCQQPSIEGHSERSLLGDPLPAPALHVHVLAVSSNQVTLDMGSAAGFDVGTQFAAVDSDPTKQKTVVEVRNIDGALASTAQIITGSTNVSVGQTLELTNLRSARTARIAIFSSRAEGGHVPTLAKALFPGVTWVREPTDTAIDLLVVHGNQGWFAYDQHGHVLAPGPGVKGTAFLVVAPPAPLRDALEGSEAFQQGAFVFTDNLSDADYFLAAREEPTGSTSYSLVDPVVLIRHSATWVRSPEHDVYDAELNGIEPQNQPEVVCRNDMSFPVRTAWLRDSTNTGRSVAGALIRRIRRLGRLRVWTELAAPKPGPALAGWPFRLVVTQDENLIEGPLRPNEEYDVGLAAAEAGQGSHSIIPRYVYLISFDCSANPDLAYPLKHLYGEAPQPVQTSGSSSLNITLATRLATPPLGADTFFLLVTRKKINNPTALVDDDVFDLTASRTETTNWADDAAPSTVALAPPQPFTDPVNGVVQRLVVPSSP
jgi:hypothetical protein